MLAMYKAALGLSAFVAGAALVTPADAQQAALEWIAVSVAVALAAIAGWTQVLNALHQARTKAATQEATTDAKIAAALLQHERVYHSGSASVAPSAASGVSVNSGMESALGGGHS